MLNDDRLIDLYYDQMLWDYEHSLEDHDFEDDSDQFTDDQEVNYVY
jgi:hypothetical protein